VKIYLLARTDTNAASAFRVHYILENLVALKKVSLFYFVGVIAIIIAAYAFKLNLDGIVNIPGFLTSLYSTLFITPLFYLSSALLIKNFNHKKQFLRLSQILVMLFALYLISRGMLNTFYAMHNPRNSLTMYMIWLILVSVFFVFEYYETIFVTLVFLIGFSVLLPYFQHDSDEVIKNQFVSVTLLALFFFSSRHVFSYRANHFIQLKTIQEKNLEIENANHLKDEILGIVAHDLRNPLAVIEGVSTLMQMDLNDADEDGKENLAMVKASCEKARSIINDLIEVARNDSVENFGVEEVELNQFLGGITNEWLHNRSGLTELVFTGTKRSVYTRVNKEKIQRVMDNLISNAIKFSIEGDKIEVLLKQGNGKCIIEVKDHGLGIPDELLPYVFDRFSKASRKGVRGEDSIGMGLNIARQIIKKHGGDITVESIEQQGTTFTIALPQ
jgi:two-component system sensor histidine kinase VicK